MNCVELLKKFIEINQLGTDKIELVKDRINAFNDIAEDRSDVEYSNALLTSILIDSFNMNSENLKITTDYCIKKGLQIGRRHKKILLRYFNYRLSTDKDLFFKELSLENGSFDLLDIDEKINQIKAIDEEVALNQFMNMWNIALKNNDTKKMSDYLFAIYSKLHAYFNRNEMTNQELFNYNKPFIKNDISEDGIKELEEFCKSQTSAISFYDKYISILKKELQKMSLNNELEPVMNQIDFDELMQEKIKVLDRGGDLHYILTESYDAVYLRLNQQIYDLFKNKRDFLNYVLDCIQQAYRILTNNKVFAVEIDNIYDNKRNIKWLLYSYIGIFAERFIKTVEKRKFYAPDKICYEMFRVYGITVAKENQDEVKNKLLSYYKGDNSVEKDLFNLTNHSMSKEQFSAFLNEWKYVYYGFSFNDCFVIRGKKDIHEQYISKVQNDNKLLFIFYKYRMDERKIPCPVCSGLNVSGNSYPEIGHRSWECKNVICRSRSKSNRGKRYSFKTNYMQLGATNTDNENLISKEMIGKWRKDIVSINNHYEVYEMFIKYFSFPDEKILFINGDLNITELLSELGRDIYNISLIGNSDWYTTNKKKIPIDDALFENYFEKGSYINRFLRIKPDVSEKKDINETMNSESDAYIINGDSFEILHSMEPTSVAAAVTSPPYYNAREYSQWENIYLYYYDMFNIIRKVKNVLCDSGVFLYNIGDVNGNEMTIAKSNMGNKRLLLGAYTVLLFEKAGFELVDNYIWNKGEPQSKRSTNDGNFTPHYQKPVNCYEHMFLFKIKGNDLDINEEALPKEWGNFVVEFMPVYKINCKGENTLGHTAPFPENIPEFVTKTFGKAGKYILDPFLGSGTSIISAVKYGYRGVGIELSKEYAELARRRFAKELPGKKIKIV